MTEEERIEGRKYAAWLNLFIGIYNIYLFGIDFNMFNIVIGSLNIGVWVFFRDLKLKKSHIKGVSWPPKITLTPSGWEAFVKWENKNIIIRKDGKVWVK